MTSPAPARPAPSTPIPALAAMAVARNALIVFARAPELGQVKTRIATELGEEAALGIYRSLAEGIISAVRDNPAYSVTVAYTPSAAEAAMREWLGPSVALLPQADGDLGARMAGAIADAIRAGADRVVVIGTDCPAVTAETVEGGFERLATVDVVLGPALDGGYYLVGMSRVHPQLFRLVPWSSADTLRVTLEIARATGLSVALLDEQRDIDTADDWRAWTGSADQSSERPR